MASSRGQNLKTKVAGKFLSFFFWCKDFALIKIKQIIEFHLFKKIIKSNLKIYSYGELMVNQVVMLLFLKIWKI